MKGIKLSSGDELVGLVVVSGDSSADSDRPDENATLLTACENGYGKRTTIKEYRAQNRGGKGLIDIQAGDGTRNGPVIGVVAVADNDEIMAIASSGKIVRMQASDVSIVGRNTKGVRLVTLSDSEKISALARISEDQDSEDLVESSEGSAEDGSVASSESASEGSVEEPVKESTKEPVEESAKDDD